MPVIEDLGPMIEDLGPVIEDLGPVVDVAQGPVAIGPGVLPEQSLVQGPQPNVYERAVSTISSLLGTENDVLVNRRLNQTKDDRGTLEKAGDVIGGILGLPQAAFNTTVDSLVESMSNRPKTAVEKDPALTGKELESVSQSLTDSATLGLSQVVRDILGVENESAETALGKVGSFGASLAGFGTGMKVAGTAVGANPFLQGLAAGSAERSVDATREDGLLAVPGAVMSGAVPDVALAGAMAFGPSLLKSLRDRPALESPSVIGPGSVPGAPASVAATAGSSLDDSLAVPTQNAATQTPGQAAAGAPLGLPPISPAATGGAPGGGVPIRTPALDALNAVHDKAETAYNTLKDNAAANESGFLGPFEKFTTKLKQIGKFTEKQIDNLRAVKSATHGSGGLSKLFAERTINDGRALSQLDPSDFARADQYVFNSRTLEIERSFNDKIAAARLTGDEDLVKKAQDEAAEYVYPKGAEPDKVRKAFTELAQTDPMKLAKFEEYNKKLLQVTKEETIDRMKAAGLLTDEQYDAMAQYGYNPRLYQRHLEEAEGALGIESGRINPTSIGRAPVSSLHGGSPESPVTNQADLLALTFARTQSAIQKNETNKELANLISQSPVVRQPNGTMRRSLGSFLGSKSPREGYTELRYVDAGKPVSFEIPTELARLWSVGDPDLNRAAITIMGKSIPIETLAGTKLIKEQITGAGNPFFATKLGAYGAGFASTFSEEFGQVIPVALGQYTNEFRKALPQVVAKKGPEFDEFVRAGGLTIYEPRIVNPDGVSEAGKEIVRALRTPVNVVNTTGMLAVYNRARQNGKTPSQAILAARRVNGLQEPSAGIHFVGSLIPYADAGINQSRSAWQYAKRNPQAMAFKTAQVAAIGAGLEFYNEAVAPGFNQQIPARRRTTSLNIALPFGSYVNERGETIYRGISIPADQTMRAVLAASKMGADSAMGLPVDWAMSGDALTDMMLPIAGPSGAVPAPMLVGISQAIAGMASGAPFVNPDTLQERKPVLPNDPYGRTPTNPAYMGIGRQTGVNPVRLEYLMNKLFPPTSPLSQAMSWATRLAGEGITGEDQSGKLGMSLFLNNPNMAPYLFDTDPEKEQKKAFYDRKEMRDRRPLDRVLGR